MSRLYLGTLFIAMGVSLLNGHRILNGRDDPHGSDIFDCTNIEALPTGVNI